MTVDKTYIANMDLKSPPQKKKQRVALRLTLQVQHLRGEYVDDYLLPFKPRRTSSYYD